LGGKVCDCAHAEEKNEACLFPGEGGGVLSGNGVRDSALAVACHLRQQMRCVNVFSQQRTCTRVGFLFSMRHVLKRLAQWVGRVPGLQAVWRVLCRV
jgi:hypothetical protein